MRRRRVAIGVIVALIAALSARLNTDLGSPPRFDGAGYSVLGLSLLYGHGYREIARPDAPAHAHFPPGYPLALAALWSVTVKPRLVVVAHDLSIACTAAAAWLAWRWFRRIEPRVVANLLGLALAVNWTWGAIGGAIQSEPLYLMLSMAALSAARVRGWRGALGLGVLLGLCVLTRHVGVCLVLAVVIDRVLSCLQVLHPDPLPQGERGPEQPSPPEKDRVRDGRRGWQDLSIIGLAASLTVSPWLAWLATVRRETQVGLLDARNLLPRIGAQALFYARRLPDALTGPFIEVATVFSRSRAIGLTATVSAVIVSTFLLIGLFRSAMSPRRRLAGLVPLATLPLLLVWPFTEAGRFLIPLVPFLLVGAVEGLALCLRWLLPSAPHPNPPPKGGRGSGRPDEEKNPPPLRGRVGWGGDRRRSKRLASTLVLLATIPYPAYAILTGRAEVQRRTHADFDAACAWIAREVEHHGPVLTRHGGEVFWQTRRLAVPPESEDPALLARQIRDQDVAYVLVDHDRFANASPTVLARFVAARPDLVRLVFPGPVAVYEVRRDSGP